MCSAKHTWVFWIPPLACWGFLSFSTLLGGRYRRENGSKLIRFLLFYRVYFFPWIFLRSLSTFYFCSCVLKTASARRDFFHWYSHACKKVSTRRFVGFIKGNWIRFPLKILALHRRWVGSPTARAFAQRRSAFGKGERGRWRRNAEWGGLSTRIFRVFTEGKQMPLVLSQSVLWRSNQHLVIDPAGNQGRWFVGGFERSREFARVILVSH